MSNETILSTGDLQTSISTVRPWVRFFARRIDIVIFGTILGAFLGAILGAFFPSHMNILIDANKIIAGIILLFLWIFVEAILLSTCGTTFGKWLLKVSVRDSEGKKLTFSTALRRSFLVWLKGLGIGIPILTLITQIFAYSSLTKKGITSWDRDCHTTVSHQRIGIIRSIIAIGITSIAFVVILFGIFQ